MDPVPLVDDIVRAPKALLHDHLDGGLRPLSIVELAAETGYEGLPTDDPIELATWMRRGADRKDLVLYLETFAHTVGVMQTADALRRVARECAEDLADDGVVYAEVRFAPELHLAGGLSLDEVVAAVQDGFAEGMAAQADDHGPDPAHGDAHRRALAGDRRAGRPMARPGRGGVRHRRR